MPSLQTSSPSILARHWHQTFDMERNQHQQNYKKLFAFLGVFGTFPVAEKLTSQHAKCEFMRRDIICHF